MCSTAIMGHYFYINQQFKQNKELKGHRTFSNQNQINFLSLDEVFLIVTEINLTTLRGEERGEICCETQMSTET